MSREREPGFSVSASYLHQFDADIDEGGEFRLDRALVRANWQKRVSKTLSLGVGANYDYSDYSFSGAGQHDLAHPWEQVHTLNFVVSSLFTLDKNWKLFFAPSVGIAAESSAGWGDAIIYGGIIWTSYRFSPSLTVGFRAGVFSKPEEVSAFPLIVIDWKIDNRLRISNPLQAGPTLPAGLELSYTFDEGSTVAVGGAYRSARFRLDDHASAPEGVGEDKAFPLWVKFSKEVGSTETLRLFGGALVGGSLVLEDRKGRELADEHYDAAPFLAAAVSFKF